uniref:Centrosomal protein of 170 kDa n=1 Tax=Steinernema glaseri TaxID=37863 RepID=A0A1I8ABV2_9BILA
MISCVKKLFKEEEFYLSKDELDCMREAEYQAPPGSALSSSVPPLYPQTHSPSVVSANRSALPPRPAASQRSARPQTPSSSLLKQALANRIGDKKKTANGNPPEPLSKTNALDGTSTLSSERTMVSSEDDQSSVKEKTLRKTESEMNSSILANPAWYRDHDGRTGFIPDDYEHPENEQKSQIKVLGPKEAAENEKAAGKSQLLDCFGSKKDDQSKGASSSPKHSRKSSKERHTTAQEAEISIDGHQSAGSRTHDEEPETSRSPSLRERSESPSKKSKKSTKEKRDESSEGKRSLIGKLFRRTPSNASDLASLGGATSKDEIDLEASPKEKSKKSKRERKSSKERSAASSTSQSPVPLEDVQSREEHQQHSPEKRVSDAAEKFKELESRRSSTQLEVPGHLRKHRKLSTPSSDQSPSDSRRGSMESESSSASQNDSVRAARPSQVEMNPRRVLPAITIQADTPQRESGSPDEVPSSGSNGRYQATTSDLPPLPTTVKARPRLQDVQQSSTDSSVGPEYRVASGIRKVAPSSSSAQSTTSEEPGSIHRRDSSQSESSRFSNATHKSVTFSDHIVVTEIERKDKEPEEDRSSSSEDVSSIVSARPIQKRRKKSDEEGTVPGHSDGYHSEEVRQEDYALKYDSDESNTVNYNYNYEVQSASSSSSADVDSGVLEQAEATAASSSNLQNSQSLQSVYREDELGPDMYQMELYLSQLPEKVREAVLKELMEGGPRGQDVDIPLSGSMTRLHAEDSRPPSVASLHGFPRSASGYLDNPNLPPLYPQYTQNKPSGQPAQPTAIDESFYDNVPSSSLTQPTAQPRQGTSPSSSYPTSQPDQGTSSTHQKPPSGREKGGLRLGQKLEADGQGSSSSVSPESPVEESEMRKKFVALYGNRRAPIANASDSEECPKDPAPSAKRDSISGFSTDSWESIVSATSMKAESKLRRYFNY